MHESVVNVWRDDNRCHHSRNWRERDSLKKVIIAQGKTVEEAIAEALKVLKVQREQVEVEVLSNPSRRLLGLRKGMAEVKVTEKIEEDDHQQSLDFEKLVNAVIEEGKQGEPFVEGPSIQKGVRVKDGQLEFSFADAVSPAVEPKEHVMLYVNGKLVEEKIIIHPEDEVFLSISDELIPPQFTIQLIEEQMIALLTFSPGRKIVRTIKNTEFVSELMLSAEEKIDYYNDLEPQQIVDELKRIGVKQGIIFPAIQKVVSLEKEYELIVARGISPEEGTDGNLEVHIEFDPFNPDSLEKVDFREMSRISTIKEGEVIATHIPPGQGKDGRNLMGQLVPARQVKDIVLRFGKNVTLIDGHVIAKVAGNPIVDWKNQFIKIDVNPELYHPGEVGLESGNIRSEGDIRIGGNVLPSMFVGTSGAVQIEGAVTSGTIEAMRSAIVYGNVLSSTITVGKENLTLQELVGQLEKINVILHQIQIAIRQVLQIRGSTEEALTSDALKRLTHLLLEKKHANFKRLNTSFIQSVKEHEAELTPEWLEVAEDLERIFVAPLNEKLEGEMNLQSIIIKVETLIEAHRIEASPKGQLIVPYAVNSQLYSSGDIQVRGQGVFQSTLIAQNNIMIEGVCRGGEIIAQNHIVLQETGSENPVTTIVKTSETGRIKIGTAYVGTEIQIGNRKHAFMRDEYDIHARLDEGGELILR